ETLTFFLTAGVRGLLFSRHPRFARFLFGAKHEFSAASGTRLRLAVALAAVSSLIGLYLTFALVMIVALADLFVGMSVGALWLYDLRTAGTVALLAVEGVAALLGLCGLAGAQLWRVSLRRRLKRNADTGSPWLGAVL